MPNFHCLHQILAAPDAYAEYGGTTALVILDTVLVVLGIIGPVAKWSSVVHHVVVLIPNVVPTFQDGHGIDILIVWI